MNKSCIYYILTLLHPNTHSIKIPSSHFSFIPSSLHLFTPIVSFYVIAWHVFSQIRDKTSQICRIIAVRCDKTCHPSGWFIPNLRQNIPNLSQNSHPSSCLLWLHGMFYVIARHVLSQNIHFMIISKTI
jgi:hypothetical protein